jgi:hypothetical protein
LKSRRKESFFLIERQAASTKQLLRASFDDETALQYPLPHSGFGFHAQQAVEKLYKALLVSRLGRYPFSHDLTSLRKSVEACGITLPHCGFTLERLSEYAGNARYDDPIPLGEEERLTLRGCIADLRKFVQQKTGSDSE